MKPSMTAIELQHMTRLLAGSGDVRGLQSSGPVQAACVCSPKASVSLPDAPLHRCICSVHIEGHSD